MRLVPFQTPKRAMLKLKKKCRPLFSRATSETDHKPLKSVFKTGDSQVSKAPPMYASVPIEV